MFPLAEKIAAFLKCECSGWRRTEIAWFAFCLSSVGALSWWWGDSPLSLAAALTGICYTVLAGKGKISCFAFGLVNTPLYAFIAFRYGYFGDMILNGYYFLMMFPGIVSWWRNRDTQAEKGIVRTRLSPRGRLRLLLGSAAGVTALWFLLDLLGGSRPLCDALTNVLSVAAMVLTVRRCLEQWAMWIAVDLIEVFMWFKVWSEHGNSVSLLVMWLLFLANGFYLRRIWLRDSK